MESNSDIRPPRIMDLGDGSYYYNYNIREEYIEQGDGTQMKGYKYDYVHIWNKPTLEAIISVSGNNSADFKADAYKALVEGNYAPFDLGLVKQIRIEQLNEYDKSSEVNGFIFSGQTMWIDKLTRIPLLTTLAILEGTGEVETELWTEGLPPVAVPLEIATLKKMLYAIEIYAKLCLDVTKSHASAIFALKTEASVWAYNFIKNYPPKLNFDEMAGS